MSLNKILDAQQIEQKIRRMVFQIYEHNFEEAEVVLVGISGGGYVLAEKVKKFLNELTTINTSIHELYIDKKQPANCEITLACNIDDLAGKVVILIDDVLNTGRTLVYSLSAFLKVRLKKLEVLVLVERNHRNFPISANYIGYSLSTTLQEHINVVLVEEEDNIGVYLS